MKKLVGIALSVALMVGVAGTAQAAKAPREFYGVTPQTKLGQKDFARMGKGNVGTLRYAMPWGDIDPQPTEEELVLGRQYRWWFFDPIVYLAAEQGIRVLPTVYGTPHWVGLLQGCWGGCWKLGPRGVGAQVAFSQFMTAAAQRYGRGGEFWAQHPELPYKPITTWQVWNEQNSSDFWKPVPNVADYADLVAAGGNAVHAVDPRADVLLGGMIGEPGQAGKSTVSGWKFLNHMYRHRRARAAFDGIAIHPYGASVKSIKGTVHRWRKELRRVGAPRDRIWVTEIGWASGGGDHPLNRGLDGQAELLRHAFEWFTKVRRKLHIANIDYFAWRDSAPGSDPCVWCAKSGLFRYRNFAPKPAWTAFKSFTR